MSKNPGYGIGMVRFFWGVEDEGWIFGGGLTCLG